MVYIFPSLLAAGIVNNDIKKLTGEDRKNVFIIDDSLFGRTGCKKQNWDSVFLTIQTCILKTDSECLL